MEWHTESRSAVLGRLSVDAKHGLNANDVKERRAEHGPNRLSEAKRRSWFSRLALQFTQFIILILIAAAILSALLGEWVDAGAIVAIVLLNGIIGFVQEEKAERVIEALKRLAAPTAKVLRDSRPATIEASEIVPGDIVQLESGDHVPADLRILDSAILRIDEAALTGESLPIDKTGEQLSTSTVPLAERNNMAYLGTNVVYGRGTGVVTAVGMKTEMGAIATMLQRIETEPTPLQRRLFHFAKLLVYAALAICALVFVLGILRGNDLMEMLLTAISLAVAAIPEGLPAVVTIVLALGVQRMVARNALIRKLPSVETLGAATVIASDKTGTLTQNQMTVKRLYLPDSTFVEVTGTGYSPDGEFEIDKETIGRTGQDKLPGTLERAIETALMASSAQIQRDPESGRWRVIGDPTEGALVSLALKAGTTKERLLERLDFSTEFPFDSRRKIMTTVYTEKESAASRVYVKGAIERVLELCTTITDESDGRLRPLTQEDRERVLKANEELTGSAMRVLCMAHKIIEGPAAPYRSEEIESGLTFTGLVGMIDPPRAEVKKAVEQATRAGILPLMITGDHKLTAIAIAREIGAYAEGDTAVTGAELDLMDEAAFKEELPHIRVYARVNPEHKLRVVRAWRDRGDIIAMTGDGVNDAPALKEADIGIAMGITGTDVTREAADMILVDDNFATIVSAVEEGRGIFDNIRRVVHFLLSCNIGEILVLLVATLLGLPLPLLPVQILWTNLVTDGLPALGLAMEPVEKGVMERAPRSTKTGIVTGRLMWVMLLQGAFIAACTLVAYCIDLYYFDSTLLHARTVAFTTLILSQKFHVFNCKSLDRSIFTVGLMKNRMLNLAVLTILCSQLLLLYIPALRQIFKLAPLGGADWLVVAAASVMPLVAGEIVKFVQNRSPGTDRSL